MKLSIVHKTSRAAIIAVSSATVALFSFMPTGIALAAPTPIVGLITLEYNGNGLNNPATGTQISVVSGSNKAVYTMDIIGTVDKNAQWPFQYHVGWDTRYNNSEVVKLHVGHNGSCMRVDDKPLGYTGSTAVYNAGGAKCADSDLTADEDTMWVLRGNNIDSVSLTDEAGGSGGNPRVLSAGSTSSGAGAWATNSGDVGFCLDEWNYGGAGFSCP